MRKSHSRTPEGSPELTPTQEIANQFASDLVDGNLPERNTDPDMVAELQAAGIDAAEQAVKLAAQRARETEQRRREFMKARAEGRPLPAVRATPSSVLDDASIPLDRDGKLAGTPGTVKRWVRMIDGAENPSAARASLLMKQGYKPVNSRLDDKPITGPFGMLMEATPAADAERRAIAMEGRVAAGKQAEQTYYDSIEQANQAAGTTVVKPFAGPDHGEKRRFGAVPPE